MVDREDLVADMLPFAPEEHDVRVQRGDWVYYVRAVRRGTMLANSLSDGSLEGLLLIPVIAVYSRVQTRFAWKVGVVRVPAPNGWKVDRARVLHKEILANGHTPAERMAALAADVRAGRFDAN